MTSLLILERERDNFSTFAFQKPEMRAFLSRGLESIEKLGGRAKLPKEKIRRRKEEYIRYFTERLGLEYSAPPFQSGGR